MAVQTLWADAVTTGTGWTNPNNSLGSNDGTSATIGTVGSPLIVTLDNITNVASVTSITYGCFWTNVNGSSARTQSLLVELINAAEDTVYASFTTATRDNPTLLDVNATFNPTHDEATISGYKLRLTPQEGGGMAGTMTHSIDAAYVTVDYTPGAVVFPSVKVGGTWRTAQVYARTGGVWYLTQPHVRASGVWYGP